MFDASAMLLLTSFRSPSFCGLEAGRSHSHRLSRCAGPGIISPAGCYPLIHLRELEAEQNSHTVGKVSLRVDSTVDGLLGHPLKSSHRIDADQTFFRDHVRSYLALRKSSIQGHEMSTEYMKIGFPGQMNAGTRRRDASSEKVRSSKAPGLVQSCLSDGFRRLARLVLEELPPLCYRFPSSARGASPCMPRRSYK